MSATTPARRRGWGGGGYYANPASPIASTPQKTPGRKPATTPHAAALSPMHGASTRQGVRKGHEGHVAEDAGDGYTQKGIFSPVLKFFSEEEEAAAEEEARNRAGGRAGVAALSPAPRDAGRGSSGRGDARDHSSSTGSSTSTYSSSSSSSSGVAVAAGAGASSAVVSYGGGAAAVVEEEEDEEEDLEFEEFNPYLFIKLLPPYHAVAPRVPRIVLPPKARHAPPISLVLDLDETLVHCSVDPIPDADLTFPVNFNGVNYQVYVRKRPYLDRFLRAIADKFEVTVFTASQQVYAERLLDLIDPSGRAIHHRLYRDSCLNVDGNYLKDLNVLGRSLKTTLLVDNSPHAFGYQVDNGVPIESWFDDRADTELLKLAAFCNTLHGLDDIRPALRKKFAVHRMVAMAR